MHPVCCKKVGDGKWTDDWVGSDISSFYRVLLPLVGKTHGYIGPMGWSEWELLVTGIASWLPHTQVKKALNNSGLPSYNNIYLHLSFLFIGGKWSDGGLAL